MSDTKSDSEDSVVFVGVTQLTAHVHQESEKRELTKTLKKKKKNISETRRSFFDTRN